MDNRSSSKTPSSVIVVFGLLALLTMLLLFAILEGTQTPVTTRGAGGRGDESIDPSMIFGPKAILLRTPDLIGHLNFETSVAYSPDGSSIAVGRIGLLSGEENDRSFGEVVSLLNPADGRERLTILPNQVGSEACPVAFSPDGRSLAVGLGRDVKLYDPDTGWEQAEIICEDAFGMYGLSFSADGRWLAVATSNGEVFLCNVEERRVSQTIPVHIRSVEGVALSPDGRWVASASRGPFVHRREPTGRFSRLFTGYAYRSISDGGFVRLYDTATGDEVSQRKLEWRAWSVAFSPDGRTLAAGGGGVALLWDLTTEQDRTLVEAEPNFDVYSVAFSPDGRMLAIGLGTRGYTGSEGEVRLWDLERDQVRAVFRDSKMGKIRSLAFSPDGRSLVTGSAESILLWDVPTAEERAGEERTVANVDGGS